jgi:hypothetical protein
MKSCVEWCYSAILMWLIAQEDYIAFTHHENFKYNIHSNVQRSCMKMQSTLSSKISRLSNLLFHLRSNLKF